jgi:hypothetical protein
VQLFRPTDSLSLYLQQVGRGLRKCDGKPYAVVLDHVGNSHRHGLPTDDREWTLEGKVGRQGGEKAPSVKFCPQCFTAMPSGKPKCPDCGHQFVAERRELEHVDGELVEVQRRPELPPVGPYKKGDIVRDLRHSLNTYVVLSAGKNKLIVTNIESNINKAHGFGVPASEVEFVRRPDPRREQATATTVEQLVALGKQRRMKNPHGWARHVMAARQAKGQWSKVA